ncbi:hypothetical protein HKBW3S42_01188 [Candidatus Hakubella thermalkaliphila]|uniref:Uncharacterized protein n=1 Tax=Candidatus Hakubella thermalkaliphila TaxID=2754717 RepID=A0A6V8QEA5_9ACTN|nr:hypothetical protein HKBW3S42_01188 [Candidatus Hakubella thermalkaliphila]GFP42927.1 hypothetical protein HKBW3C_02059 [Candidatus Hakubella thermalkaliphila]
MTKREKLEKYIKIYEANVRYLEGSLYEEVASMLTYRDLLEELLTEIGTKEDRKKVAQIDEELREKRNLIREDLKLLRKSAQGPPESYWWWYLDKLPEEQKITA